MELIYNLDENNYKVVQYKNTDTMKTFKLKYPINTTDSINDILNKISISCKESEISSDHLFVFVQKQMIKESHIDALEEKILSNKTLRKLIKSKFPNWNKMNNSDMKQFVKDNKSILEEEIKSGRLSID